MDKRLQLYINISLKAIRILFMRKYQIRKYKCINGCKKNLQQYLSKDCERWLEDILTQHRRHMYQKYFLVLG